VSQPGKGLGRLRDPLFLSAVIALVFVASVAAIMLYNWLPTERLVVENPLLALKEQLARNPGDEALVAQIRNGDANLRSEQQRYLRVQELGSWMLVIGLAVAALALLLHRPRRLDVVAHARERVAENEKGHRRGVAAAIGFALLVVVGCTVWVLQQPERTMEVAPAAVAPQPSQWPRFRGAQGSGIAPDGNYATKWDVASGEGIVWQVPTGLEGHGSPILAGGLVCLSGMVGEGRFISCFRESDGSLAWRAAVEGEALAPGVEPFTTPDTGWAASTPVVAGNTIFALFGTGHAGAFDLQGKALWLAHLGTPETAYGFASSPVTDGERFFVQFDQVGDRPAVLYAFDALRGGLAWRAARPAHSSWATPLLADRAEGKQLITAANPLVISYDPVDGSELWRADVLGGDVAPSPIVAGGMVLVIQPRRHLTALRIDGRGDVTKTHVVWRHESGVPDIPTPLATDEHVYLLSTEGRMHVLKTPTGEVLHKVSLKGIYRASPTLANGNLYLFDSEGIGKVYRWQDGWSEIGGGKMGEEVSATPVFGSGSIYVRGSKKLVRIGDDQGGAK
jgi:outer membrane protein assembly factor BamB